MRENEKTGGVGYLAACDLAWRLNSGQSLEDIACQDGCDVDAVREQADRLFNAHPGARDFTLPDLPMTGIRLVK